VDWLLQHVCRTDRWRPPHAIMKYERARRRTKHAYPWDSRISVLRPEGPTGPKSSKAWRWQWCISLFTFRSKFTYLKQVVCNSAGSSSCFVCTTSYKNMEIIVLFSRYTHSISKFRNFFCKKWGDRYTQQALFTYNKHCVKTPIR
jgi:hypothetical protein